MEKNREECACERESLQDLRSFLAHRAERMEQALKEGVEPDRVTILERNALKKTPAVCCSNSQRTNKPDKLFSPLTLGLYRDLNEQREGEKRRE
ncbi:hypothetical protein MHYP_G00030880 [Metynnis hypsauchen]